jgi:catechol 2,3-dioxygenase-like lactoylglutathione lyase family enzyme
MWQKIARRNFIALAGGALVCPRLSLGEVNPPTVLDHILLGCNDLDRGIDFVEEHTGVRAVFGGIHPGRGTRNALLSLGERHYLEIIAPDPQQAGVSDSRNLRELVEPRLVGWAAHPGDISQFTAHLRRAGIEFEGPTPGSRKRPDGHLLQWNTLNLKNDEQGVLPFFIEWSAGTIHPSMDAPSGCKIESFTISSPNEVKVRELCSRLNLDVHVEHSEKSNLHARISGLNGQGMQLNS